MKTRRREARDGRGRVLRNVFKVGDARTFSTPSIAGTVGLLFAILIGWSLSASESTLGSLSVVAWSTAAGLGVAGLLEMRAGVINLLRADMIALAALFYLTLAEFLSSDYEPYLEIRGDSLSQSINLVLLALIGLSVGRHLPLGKRTVVPPLKQSDGLTSNLLRIFWICAVVGYFNVFYATDFDLVAIWDGVSGPRFSAPWGRGRFGNWSALLYEFSMLQYCIPPIYGLLLNRWRSIGAVQTTLISVVFLVTLLFGFCSGTRNILAVYMSTFLAAFILSGLRGKWSTILLVFVTGVAFLGLSQFMLRFREVGLRNYLKGEVPSFAETITDPLIVDSSMINLALVTGVFPERFRFLGLEVVWWALIKPIPRALWPGKPTGLSVTIEESVGAGEEWTVATTFVGEAYMSGGDVAVFIFAFGLGALCRYWNSRFYGWQRLYDIAIYASGLFAIQLSMRSIFWLTTAILPSFFLIFARRYFDKNASRGQVSRDIGALRSSSNRPKTDLLDDRE